MACSGDATQSCGGVNRLNVIQDNQYAQSFFTVAQTGKWSFTDCIVDSTLKRSLANSLSNNTPEKCLAASQTAGYTCCGMESSGECYGSSTAPSAASAPSVGSSDPVARDCSMPYAGSSTVACGGSGRLNLYTYLGSAAKSVSPSVLQ